MKEHTSFTMTVEEAVEQFSTDVFRMAYARTNNKTDAEDITQETFIKYMKETKPFEDANHVKAWLLRVTINQSINLVTSAWYRKSTAMEEADAIAKEIEDKSDVYYAVMKLPPKYKTVIHLYYYEGYSVQEISSILGIKESTIKSQLKRARSKLKEMLKEEIDV